MMMNVKETLIEKMELTDADLEQVSGGSFFEGPLTDVEKGTLDMTIHFCKYEEGYKQSMEEYLAFSKANGVSEETLNYLRKNWNRVR